MSKLWGGRFTKGTGAGVDHFHSSISFDKRLYRQDIEGSIAHARMLGKQGIIPDVDVRLILQGLTEILGEIESGTFIFDEKAEDIHMNIETMLIEKIGDAGKRLHTGRSRNDQVALDLRIYVKEEINNIREMVQILIRTLVSIAEKHIYTIMPGYTHLQRAQPITFAHHLTAYVEMFKRDIFRLENCYSNTDIMPLGSGALAGTTYPLDRDFICDLLGFQDVSLNSLDAVSDRDFCLELLSVLSIMMMHLSRFCEEIILWSSHEFAFIELDDAYTTGSSIMPQKKNPDMAELIRGKTGRVYGDLFALLTTMKGLPLAYNKDLQEDKEAVFDAIDTVKMCLPIFGAMIDSAKINEGNMLSAAKGGFTNATDAADWLVKKGVAFRDAHEIIGKLVLYSIRQNKNLDELSLQEYRNISMVFDNTIYDAIDLNACVNNRLVDGGPSPVYIQKLLEIYRHEFAK